MKTNVFLIAGCFRSGTTLLRLCLNSHPDIVCYDEGQARVQLEYGRKQTEKIQGYKVPFLSLRSDLETTFGEPAKVIWMERDPAAVVASMLEWPTYHDGQSYFERWLKNELFRNAAFCIHFAPLLEEAMRLEGRGKTIAMCAIVWAACRRAFTLHASNSFLLVNYEQLVANPHEQLAAVATFLDVPFDQALLEHHLKKHDEVDQHGIGVGGTQVNRPIDQNSVLRYKAALSATELELCDSFLETK